MNKLGKLWGRVRESLWFIPGLMVSGSFLLALLLIEVDNNIDRKTLLDYPRVFGVGADGSRGMLVAIASSMLTVAALAFSLTLNTVAQASSQYTPRVIRNYLDDHWNQFAFGYFVSAFTYCLIVLRSIRGGDDAFIPGISVITGLLLAIGGVGVLIYFIHHIGVSLQATNIVARISRETRLAIDSLYPEQLGEGIEKDPPDRLVEALDLDKWHCIRSTSSGYIQDFDVEAAEELAHEYEMVIRTERELGEFVAENGSLVSLGGLSDEPDEDVRDKINSFYTISRHRAIEQDVGFGIRQLVDIALKALSPGVNDTTTALNCLDRLGELIGVLVSREWPSNVRELNGKVLVVTDAPEFKDYVEQAFDEIRVNATGNSEALSRLIEVLAHAVEQTSSDGRRRVLFQHIELTLELAEDSLRTEHEKRKVRDEAADHRRSLARA